MNASEQQQLTADFTPNELIARAKRRRNFADRFDRFSDAYVWVLAALVALTYLFSALFGMLFVLLGEGVPHQELVTSVWDLPDLSFVLLALAALGLFRLMIFLGPVGLNAAKADWWLPLPISMRALRVTPWRNAMLTGLLAGCFSGALWLIIMFGIIGAFPWTVAGMALACFAVAGIAIANSAVLVQALNLHKTARRWCTGAFAGLALFLAVLWVLLFSGVVVAQEVVATLSAAVIAPQVWLVVLAIAVIGAVLSSAWAYRNLERITGQALRTAGEHQQFAVGAMMQADSRAVVAPAATSVKRRRNYGKGMTARLPVAWSILVLRVVRGGRWISTLATLLVFFVLAATVQQVANPLSAAAFYLVLSIVVTLSVAGTIAPLTTNQQLTQLLGLSAATLNRTATLFAVLFSMLSLILFTGGLGLLGMAQFEQFWLWLAGLLVAAVGCAAAGNAHARRGERNWETLLGEASNETTIATLLFMETVTYIRVAATLAPVFWLVLSPATPIPWLMWGIAVLFGGTALKDIFTGVYRQR